jgi:hypothetical protein
MEAEGIEAAPMRLRMPETGALRVAPQPAKLLVRLPIHE